jgi:hypothetical protein
MIRYPENVIQTNSKYKEFDSLQEMINNGLVEIGMRYRINDKNACEIIYATCVDIRNNEYYFSVDNCYLKGRYEDILPYFENLYNNALDNKIFSLENLKNVQYLFVPTVEQVFGGPESDESFKWFWDGGATIVKNYNSIFYYHVISKTDLTAWFLSNNNKEQSYCKVVNTTGVLTSVSKDYFCGIPIFFQMIRKGV